IENHRSRSTCQNGVDDVVIRYSDLFWIGGHMYYFHFGEIVTVQVDVGLLIDLFQCEHDLGRKLHPHESLILDIEFTARRNHVASSEERRVGTAKKSEYARYTNKQ